MSPDDRRLLIQAHLALIAARIMELRADRCLKQCVGVVSVPTVYRILQGSDHKISTLIDIADALECDVTITITKRPAA